MGDEREIPDKSCTSESTSPPKMKKGRTVLIKEKKKLFQKSLLKISDAETRGELRGKVEALIETMVDAVLENEQLIVDNQKVKSEKVQLERKLEDVLWPVRVRNLIFKVEIIFGIDKLDVCYQCARVTVWHSDGQRCSYDPKTWEFPSNPENQRIFIRFHRWIYFLFSDQPSIMDDYRVKNLKLYLKEFYDSIQSKSKSIMTSVEEFLCQVPDFDSFKKLFCYSIAEACEYCNQRVKEDEQFEPESKIEKINECGMPIDDFLVLFINSFAKKKIAGPKIVYKPKIILNPEIACFVPSSLLQGHQ